MKLIKASLEEKCSLSQLDLMSKEQSLINEFLCSENLVARWKWTSGNLVAKNLIPWESQCTNTLADNFLWSANDPFVTLVAAGFYEVTLGVFSRKKPTCQVFLNGEPLLSMANANSYVVHHSSGKLKDVKSALSGPTGLTMVEYFLLPHRARISVSYVCDLPGEGFICIRRIT